MQSNKIKTRFCVLAAGTAIISFAVPQAAQAASPPFAYTEEKWDSLRDNKLEYDEIGDLIHEYNSTVLSNQIAYEDYKGKDSDEVARTYYDTADEIYAGIEYPDSDDANYGTRLAAAQSSELQAEQMIDRGDENVTDGDVVKWGYDKTEKSLVPSAQILMITYWKSQASLDSSRNAKTTAEKSYETTRLQAAAGTAAQSAVLSARDAVMQAEAAITSAESAVASAKENLCLMLGWKYGDEVEIGELPEPEPAMSSSVNLDEDLVKAVENNYDIKILSRQIKNARQGATQRQYEETLKSSEEAVKANVKSAWQSLLLAETQYAQTVKSFELEEKNMQAAERKRAAGTMSLNEYQSRQISYNNAVTEKETAAMTLLEAQQSYRWAVDGLASTV